jgi:AraC-binding-like domain
MTRRVTATSSSRVMKIRGRGPGALATLEVIHGGFQPVVDLRYSMPVRIDAGDFRRLMLIQTCLEGSGTAVQGDARAAWRRGQTLPLSPGLNTQLEFDGRFAQRAVRLDIDRLESLCSRLINAPLDRPLRFELRPFSSNLETAWEQAVRLMSSYEQMNIVLPQPAARSLDEFLLSMVLTQHPHNYTDELRNSSRTVAPRIVREAEQLMRRQATPIVLNSSLRRTSPASDRGAYRYWRSSQRSKISTGFNPRSVHRCAAPDAVAARMRSSCPALHKSPLTYALKDPV